MKLNYIEVSTLPCRAWCAMIHKGEASIYHGQDVEIFEGGFTEGAWDGPFSAEGLENATIISGTAVLLGDESLKCFSSSDRLCPLFSMRSDGKAYISNSPSFLLASAGSEVDLAYPLHLYDLLNIWRKGLFNLSGKMRVSSREHFNIHFSAIVTIGKDGTLSAARPPDGEFPTDYQKYHEIIQSAVTALLANASSPLRSKQMGSIVALSKGYDTNANAALVSQAGCKEAFSFYDPRWEEPYSDSGREHAHYFGLNCKELSRLAFQEADHFDEAEFCFMPIGSQATLAGAEKDLAGKVFICGNNGDLVWIPTYAHYCNERSESSARFISGIGQLEHQLRVGYVIFSPSCVGMIHSRQLACIALSEEMQPWNIGGEYNRPLARRLAEDGGLPREAFGQHKIGGGFRHFFRKEDFTPGGYQRFQQFCLERKKQIHPLVDRYWKFRVWLLYLVWKMVGYKGPRPPRSLTSWKCKFLVWNNCHPMKLKWDMLFVFMWSMVSLQKRYAVALEEIVR